MTGAQKVLMAAIAIGVAFGLGVGVGQGTSAPPRPLPASCFEEIVDQLEDASKSGEATVQILQEMARGQISSDALSLELLSDSMQELTAKLGDVRSQIEAIRRAGRLPDCPVPR
jgi:hypothetical protein